MEGLRGVLAVAVLTAAVGGCSDGSGSGSGSGGDGGGEPVPVVALVGSSEQDLRVRIEVVDGRRIRFLVPADCTPEAEGRVRATSLFVPFDVATVEVGADGSFAIDEELEEELTDGDALHTEVHVAGRFAPDGTAAGTVELSQRIWNGEAEGFDPTCGTGELDWSAEEPLQPVEPDAAVPVGSDIFVTNPVGEDLLVLLESGEVVRIDPSGGVRRLDGSAPSPPTSEGVAPAGLPAIAEMLVTGDHVWLGGFDELTRYDLTDGRQTTRIEVPRTAVHAGHGALWVQIAPTVDPSHPLQKRDARDGSLLASLPIVPGPIAAGPTGMWLANAPLAVPYLERIDPATATIVDRFELDSESLPLAIVPTADRVWLAYSMPDAPVVAVDTATGELLPVDLPSQVGSMAATPDGGLWALHSEENVARRLSPTGEVVQVVDLPTGSWTVNTTPGGALWLAGSGPDGNQVLHFAAP